MKQLSIIKKAIACMLLCFVQTGIHAQESKRTLADFKGYVKALQSVSFTDDADSMVTQNLIHNRLELEIHFTRDFSFRTAVRNRLFYGEQLKLLPGFGKTIARDEGFLDLTHLWVDKRSLVLITSSDRLAFDYRKKKFRITAGRQRINWGVTTAWNPNDLFNAYNLLDFDYEERPGTDALRLQFFPESFTALELAASPSREKNKSILACLFKFNKWKYDFQVLAAVYREDLMVGAGWAGNIGDAGFKGEISYFRNLEKLQLKNDAIATTVSFDYSFKNTWYTLLGVLYNDHPSASALLQGSAGSQPLSSKSLMPYRWTFLYLISKAFTPIFSGNLQILYSPDHHSLLVFPALAYAISQNMDLDLTAQCFFRNQDKKYQTAGNSIYLRLKRSF